MKETLLGLICAAAVVFAWGFLLGVLTGLAF